jgi:hypothetical protein
LLKPTGNKESIWNQRLYEAVVLKYLFKNIKNIKNLYILLIVISKYIYLIFY